MGLWNRDAHVVRVPIMPQQSVIFILCLVPRFGYYTHEAEAETPGLVVKGVVNDARIDSSINKYAVVNQIMRKHAPGVS